jgi:hypothetical protein
MVGNGFFQTATTERADKNKTIEKEIATISSSREVMSFFGDERLAIY